MQTIEQRVSEILVNHNLDFTIEKEQLITDTGKLTPYYGLFNSKSGECINTVKQGYTISQNSEVVELVLRGMDGYGDLSVSKAGSINGGRKIFIQLAIDGYSMVFDEKIKRYVTIIDSNDGSTSLSVGIGELVMSCQNQFYKFYKAGQSKFRHTASLTARIKEIPHLIDNALEESFLLTKTYEELYQKDIPKNMTDDIVGKLLGVSNATPIGDRVKKSNRLLNNMDELYIHIEKETNQKGKNLFGLFSGVTSYNTHKGSQHRKENGMVESMMMGKKYADNMTALKMVTLV
jgi:hypothetical protein